ncbi:hypothetical protein [Streptomyces sp. NBC_01538]|uniref:hypothetical protein n=1 Tax=Streptomyces sp. NBC_01538 TaxID=2903897 RepID=UPI003866D5AE
MTKSPKLRRRLGRGCGVRFLGVDELPDPGALPGPGEAPVLLPVGLPVRLEVLRRGMAGVLGSCRVGWERDMGVC